ncbi:MAG: hypothetical protein ICV78_08915, partial [Tolypothrix sp. Co-bin9]|nr:hypothetical protein [Tolypothrix sp. Co-bin9]
MTTTTTMTISGLTQFPKEQLLFALQRRFIDQIVFGLTEFGKTPAQPRRCGVGQALKGIVLVEQLTAVIVRQLQQLVNS